MKHPEANSDRHWDRGWEAHRRSQLARLAKLPFAAKLEWLEEAQKLGRQLMAQAKRRKANQTRP